MAQLASAACSDVHPGERRHGETEDAAVADHEHGLAAVSVGDLAQHAAHPIDELLPGLAAGDPGRQVAVDPGPEDRHERVDLPVGAGEVTAAELAQAVRVVTPTPSRAADDLGGLHRARQCAGPDVRDPASGQRVAQALATDAGPPR